MVVEEVTVEFAQHLGDLVGGGEVHGHELLPQGERGIAPVDGTAGGGVDEALHAGEDGILQQAQRAQAVDHQVALGMVYRVLVGEEGRQMENNLGAFKEDALEFDLVQDVPFHEQDAG